MKRINRTVPFIHPIYSGKKNEFQGIVQQQIPIDIVNRVSQVQLNTHVAKCITCDWWN